MAFDCYFSFIKRRVAKLYPLYALSVIVGYLGDFRKYECEPISGLLVFPKLMPYAKPQNCFTGAWFIPVVIGCYVAFPILSFHVRRLNLTGAIALGCCCAPLILMT